jgi:hypothetical protein
MLAHRIVETLMDLQDRSVEAHLSEIGTLVMGDSHAQGIHYALTDDTLHIASPGESVIQTYYRLRHILEQHPPRLTRIVLSVGVHSLLETKRIMWNVAYWARVVDFAELARESPHPWPVIARGVTGTLGFVGEGIAMWTALRSSLRRWQKGETPRTWEQQLARWDGPASTPPLSERSEEEVEMLTHRTVRAHVAFGAGFDPGVAHYFERILSLAREAGLQVLVVDMPVTHAYLARMRELTDVPATDRFIAQAVARQGADYLDLRQAFDDPALFTDPEHLSPEGRAVATQLVRRRLGLAAGEERPGRDAPGPSRTPSR